MSISSGYFDELTKRAKKSRVYKDYQLEGLEIAELLKDKKHTSLYIKLVKESRRSINLRRLAREVAERKGIRNKGAYFMSLLKTLKGGTQEKASNAKRNTNRP